MSEITAEELAAWLRGEGDRPIVVDVREPHEVATGTIADAWVSPLSAGILPESDERGGQKADDGDREDHDLLGLYRRIAPKL